MNYRKKRKAAMGFYICTGICLVAVGIAALVSYMSIDTSPAKYNVVSQNENETKTQEKSVNETSKTNNDANKVTKEEINPTPVNKEEEKEEEKEETEKEEESEKEEIEPTLVNTNPIAISAAHFILPAKANVIKGFSGGTPIYSETMRDFRVHNAVDYEGDIGMSITAASDGVVTNVYKDAMYSNVVIIKHGKYHIYYCGLDSNIKVSVGDDVRIGEVIGTLSEIPCESADVPHLHIEVYEGTEPINAESIIPK